jgi:hypothetical protein
MRQPKYLYKYKPFNEFLMKELAEQEVFFCNPKNFNDPFDCEPQLFNDIELKRLERFAFRLLSERYEDQERAVRSMNEYRYLATEFGSYNDGEEGEAAYKYHLTTEVLNDIRTLFGNIGILSLSTRWNSALMWSHYSNSHRGLCLEFEFADHKCGQLEPVTYTKTRDISLADLYRRRFSGDEAAGRRVLDRLLFSKHRDWRYEREWRAVRSPAGSAPSPFRLHAVIFGLRCEPWVVMTVVKLFSDSQVSPRFYEMYIAANGDLKRRPVDTGEIEAIGVRESDLFRGLHFIADLDEATPEDFVGPEERLPATEGAAQEPKASETVPG